MQSPPPCLRGEDSRENRVSNLPERKRDTRRFPGLASPGLISRKLADSMKGSSWIRRMFEEGSRLEAEHGADNVFDFSLGNPVVEPPAAVRQALVAAAQDASPGVHRYMPNAGYPEVREAVARHLA